MFSVFYINFGYSSAEEFFTVEDAITHARSKGFEAAIYNRDDIVASWSPIGGARRYPRGDSNGN